MNFIAFQQFVPREQKLPSNCIWCGQIAPTNRAHIISRKLATGAQNAPTLRFSICKACNLTCGSLEEWVLQFTPLSWVRMMLYLRPGANSTTKGVPSYFFSAVLNEWVVFHLDAKTHSYAVPTQLVISEELGANLLTQVPEIETSYEQLLFNMITALRGQNCKIDVRASLPEDFSPRILLENDSFLLITRDNIELQGFTERIIQLSKRIPTAQQLLLENTGQERYHFQWSGANWARFCAKVALEALCLFEGGEKCLRPAFSLVRNFVLRDTLKTRKEIIFDERGPCLVQDVPLPVFVDLTPGQNAPRSLPKLLQHGEPGMHNVTLYEIRGWVVASITFAGFPSSVLVLGGPDEHLADLYQLIYDNKEAKFDFVRLAYDQTKPVIPMPVSGDHFSDLAETYRLVSVQPST